MRWIIGDIHGMLAPLEALIAAIERNDPQRQLMFVGDYVNRGPDSKRVIDLLLSLSDAHFIRGNHDDIFDCVLCGMGYWAEPGDEHRLATFNWFMQHGLDKTFLSYGVDKKVLATAIRKPSAAALNDLAKLVPAAHRAFIRNLPVVLETDDMFVAHAKWDIYTPTKDPPMSERLLSSANTRYNLIWGRYPAHEVDAEKAWERTGYFGHTPVDAYRDNDALLPVVGPRIILLDTAAALVAHGRLTAVCHETGTFLQADPKGNLVPNP
jgi:serine/threonine protein phosphatase 1